MSSMMLVSATNNPSLIQEPVSQQSVVIVENAAAIDPVINISTATSSEDIKKIAREYFKDTPVLAEIARCESTYRQFNADGTVLRGKVNARDVGVMQINERYHSARSKQLGMDIHTLEGNLQYGAFLYKEQGSQPWSASRPCWGKTSATVAANI